MVKNVLTYFSLIPYNTSILSDGLVITRRDEAYFKADFEADF